VALSDLLLHPVRLRIVQAFLGRGELTTSEVREHVADVPAATLYRQVTALLEGGILEVVDERKVRGSVERTLVLRTASANLGPDEAVAMTADEHRRAFVTFVAGLIGDFDRYLAGGNDDLPRDRVGYRQYAAHLSDEEMDELVADLREVILPRLELQPAPGRTRRLISHVFMQGTGSSRSAGLSEES
jgi:DNA-binding transcriptional ArsR family regulator